MTAYAASGEYGTAWKKEESLTQVSHTNTGFWHSGGENHPWLTLKMANFENDVHVVSIDDRKDCCYERFKEVEVSVGNSPSVNAKDKTSCGIQSWKSGTKPYM